jgi:hypothetical protein
MGTCGLLPPEILAELRLGARNKVTMNDRPLVSIRLEIAYRYQDSRYFGTSNVQPFCADLQSVG